MFKKDLNTIMKTFVRARDQLKVYISDKNREVAELQTEERKIANKMQTTQMDRAQAEAILENLKGLLGEK